MRWITFISLFLFYGSSFANGFSADDQFQSSLKAFNQSQRSGSCSKVADLHGQCPQAMVELAIDDSKNRILIFESIAPLCRQGFENSKSKTAKTIQDIKSPELLQNAFEKNKFSYLGEYTHQTAKSCLQNASTKNNFVLSKFYHYAARLNETAGKIAQEQVLIHQILGSPAPECPNIYLLTAANDYCKKALACPAVPNITQLAERVAGEEIVYASTTANLSKLPKNCDDEVECKKTKTALSLTLAGLISKNPWFLNDAFMKQKSHWPTSARLKKYLNLASENLKQQQKKIEKSTMCLHVSKDETCDIDEMREVLSLTRSFTDHSGGEPVEQVIDRYMELQTCLEEKSLLRNQASQVVKSGVKDAVLGLIALPIGARMVAGKLAGIAVSQLSLLIGAEIAVNVMSSQDSWREMGRTCFQAEEMNFQFKPTTGEQVCKNSESSLSVGNQDRSSCLVNAGLSVLTALPFATTGSQMLVVAKRAGFLSPAKVSVKAVVEASHSSLSTETAAAGSTASRRTEDVNKIAIEKRTNGPSNFVCKTCPADKVLNSLPTVPNLPKEVQIFSTEKVDGSSVLKFKATERLPAGEWVSVEKEFQTDPITGAINANYPEGRELFEKMAQAKAGKAYFAFVDVGSLGFVNRTFKEGSSAGDRYLKAVAEKIMELGEGKITLGRTGGDEFGLIIDEVDPVKAQNLIKKIQEGIKNDFKGDAKRIFFEEKAALAAEARAANSAEEKAAILEKIKDLSKTQEPDVSIGITQMGAGEKLSDLALRSEPQAVKMKISTAVEKGRSPEKYGSKETPNARPNNRYVAPIERPIPSPTWQLARSADSAPPLSSLRPMVVERKEDLMRFSDISVVRFEDELGRSSYKTERFIVDPINGKRVPVISDIPTRGATGLLDGSHSEGEKLISSFLGTHSEALLVEVKLKSLKYLNYFSDGTISGDEVLEAVADLIKRNMRRSDLNFKLPGADFLSAVKASPPQDLNKLHATLNDQLKTHPKVIAVLEREAKALAVQLKNAATPDATKEVQKKIDNLKNFNFDLQFQSVNQSEVNSKTSFKEIQKKLDAKFEKH